MTSNANRECREPVVLIGLRGSGKTTVGRALAKVLGCDFVDTDAWIVSQAGRSIADIFAAEGESGFRVLERQAVEAVADQRSGVISVGGGAILDQRNVETLKRLGTMVWLDAEPTSLWDRIRNDPSSKANRPGLTDCSGIAEVRLLNDQRAALYEAAADHQIDTTKLTGSDVVYEIGKLLGYDVANWSL